MNTELLKYFLTVAETKNITKAAQKLKISQPSLSNAIRRLEHEVGYDLFDHKSRSIELNEYGQVFRECVMAAHREMLSGMDKLTELKRMRENFLVICAPAPEKRMLHRLLGSEGYLLKFQHIQDDGWQQEILDGSLDIAFTFRDDSSPGITQLFLRNTEIVFVCGKNHPLAKTSQISVSDITGYTFSSTSVIHSSHACALKQLEAYKIKPYISFLGDTADVIYSLKSGNNLALMERSRAAMEPDLVSLKVEGVELSLPMYLYFRKNNTRDAVHRAVTEILSYYGSLQSNISNPQEHPIQHAE